MGENNPLMWLPSYFVCLTGCCINDLLAICPCVSASCNCWTEFSLAVLLNDSVKWIRCKLWYFRLLFNKNNTPAPHPSCLWFYCQWNSNKFWTEGMQEEYLSSPHAFVCELPFTKSNQLLPWDTFSKITHFLFWFYVCLFFFLHELTDSKYTACCYLP